MFASSFYLAHLGAAGLLAPHERHANARYELHKAVADGVKWELVESSSRNEMFYSKYPEMRNPLL